MMQKDFSNSSRFAYLRFALFLLLFGYGWHYALLGPFSSITQLSSFNFLVGFIMIGTSLFIWTKYRMLWMLCVIICLLCLFTDSLFTFIHSGYLPEQLFEHGIKLLLPIAFILETRISWTERKSLLLIKVAIASTFIGHGLFALGWHQVPEKFHAMVTAILGITHEQSEVFLLVIGLLDILTALLLFVQKKTPRIVLLYLIIWGTLTAIARAIYPWSIELAEPHTFYDGIAGTVYRIPHALLPLLLMNIFKQAVTIEN